MPPDSPAGEQLLEVVRGTRPCTGASGSGEPGLDGAKVSSNSWSSRSLRSVRTTTVGFSIAGMAHDLAGVVAPSPATCPNPACARRRRCGRRSPRPRVVCVDGLVHRPVLVVLRDLLAGLGAVAERRDEVAAQVEEHVEPEHAAGEHLDLAGCAALDVLRVAPGAVDRLPRRPVVPRRRERARQCLDPVGDDGDLVPLEHVGDLAAVGLESGGTRRDSFAYSLPGRFNSKIASGSPLTKAARPGGGPSSALRC